LIVRREIPSDVESVRAVVAAAFAGDSDGVEPVETRLLDELRSSDAWMPALSLVATDAIDASEVVGHAVCTRAFVDGLACVGLGPIAVAPARQRGGVGTALMHTMLGVAEGLGEPLVGLLGSPAYYSRFGFVASTELGVAPPDPGWGEFFQVRALSGFTTGMRGVFEYAAPFGRL